MQLLVVLYIVGNKNNITHFSWKAVVPYSWRETGPIKYTCPSTPVGAIASKLDTPSRRAIHDDDNMMMLLMLLLLLRKLTRLLAADDAAAAAESSAAAVIVCNSTEGRVLAQSVCASQAGIQGGAVSLLVVLMATAAVVTAAAVVWRRAER